MTDSDEERTMSQQAPMSQSPGATPAHTVAVVLEPTAGTLRPSQWELVTVARRLGALVGVTVGDLSAPTLAELGRYGLGTVVHATSNGDVRLVPVAAQALADAAQSAGADTVLIGSSFPGKELAALIAWRWGCGLMIDTEPLGYGDDGAHGLRTHRRIFSGTWDVVSDVVTPRAVATVRTNVEPARQADTGAAPATVSDLHVTLDPAIGPVAFLGRTDRSPHQGRPALAEAPVVVAGGRGVGADFSPVEDLADALGGAVGGTRDVIDEGWLDHDAQIGQTGVTVAPRLYIGAGISGAPHHLGGMQAAGTVVAVNSDPDAPLVAASDFAIIGDAATVLPQAAAEIRRMRAAREGRA